MKHLINAAIAIATCVLVIGTGAQADVTVPTIFGDNMVLQRDVALPVWGQAAANEKVTVSICGSNASATADKDGAWAVKLPALKCTADQTGVTMTIKGANTITLKNILIGEVWVGSGQSNMEWGLGGSTGGKEAIAKADLPNIRLYHVPKTQSKTPNKDIKANWNVCSPKTCGRFSGVLFFFGQRLHADLKVPIGLINSSWGGSPIEPWTVTDASKKQGGGMYNAMIAPLQPFAVKGAIWYQGETNVLRKNGLKYFDRKKALIEGWRKTWNNDKLSFYTVQIAPWSGRYGPGELPRLWEAQVASLKLPGTGLAVITDLVDNIKDIHPRNKKPVGNRLALWALVKDYGVKDLVYSGPLYKSMKIEGAKIRISFAHAEGGLASRDGKDLSEFKIAGADGKFVPAKAVIDGQTVVVSADGVKAPKTVQFGWHKVANPNLINKAKLPASPFQTDNWIGGTGE
jgi:sialate O-acetylesterase